MEKIRVTADGKSILCEKGTTLYDLLKQAGGDSGKKEILVARVDGIVRGLSTAITEECDVRFCTYEDEEGRNAYLRGIKMIMLKAFYKEVPKDKFEKVTVENSLDTGFYCMLNDGEPVEEELLKRVEERMHKYVSEDVVFEKKSISTDKAIRLFEERKMYDKSGLIKYRRSSRVNVYKLGKVMDYFYGPMPYSTGVLKRFRLETFDGGFVFIVPTASKPDELPEFRPSMKLHRTLKQTAEWGIRLGAENVGQLNDIIVDGGMREMILVQEALHEKRIGDIAEQIAASGQTKLVTIAGPSSSGKTTFSYRLSAQLKTLGLKPHPVAMDDYFVNRVDTPKDKDGKYNYECIGAIDTKQFNQDLEQLLAGKEVQLPTYNFITGMREYNKPLMKLGEGELLVIEGIHGLNDLLTEGIAPEHKFKIYISALTSLNIDEHNQIPTTDGRLLRRIIRDARTRGHSAQKTISMWESVRAGENENIFPFQEKADAMFNSSLVYELAALKQYAEPLLFRVPRGSEEYAEAQRLLKFLDYFLGINPEEVPLNSILREFIGGGILLD
ncbi:MAG: nucleoside kinase [Roseburia sp.]|nr:nucleoside kinase [Roseburia sp.]